MDTAWNHDWRRSKGHVLYLKRKCEGLGAITRAVWRDDGVHFIERDGSERAHAEYPDLKTMNAKLRELGFPEFSIDERMHR